MGYVSTVTPVMKCEEKVIKDPAHILCITLKSVGSIKCPNGHYLALLQNI